MPYKTTNTKNIMQFLTMFLIIFMSSAIASNKRNNFRPNLPVGEYKVYPRAVIQCRRIEHMYEFNFYLNKISSNASEIRGNVTLKKQLDDSTDMFLNMAIKDSLGGWKENAFILRQLKTCTSIKKLLGIGAAMPIEFRKDIDYNGDCPIPPGVYFSSGLDVTSLLANANVPKQFFYGTYKTRIETFDKNNRQMSCVNFVLDIKRPWETL